MLVVDASCVYELLTNGPAAGAISERLRTEPDQAAPSLVDVEIVGLIRRDHQRGVLDETMARLALRDFTEWPGERFPTSPFLERVWELRDNVRTADAFYVALAEVLDCSLLTLDRRLASATGPRCAIDVLG